MKKTEFYEKHGHEIKVINPGDIEYGEHLILYPEENEIAQSYNDQGYTVYTVYEESHEGGDEYVEYGLDTSRHPYKVGYFVLDK